MTPEQLLEQICTQCETGKLFLQQQTTVLTDFARRLLQITQQMHKNIEVRDTEFGAQFNAFCLDLRKNLDKREPVWTQLRSDLRQVPAKSWTGDLALIAKGVNSRAKAFSRACDEFETAYTLFIKQYKNFTAFKLNVWLLTSAQTDITNLCGKILFLAREIAKQTEENRGKNVIG